MQKLLGISTSAISREEGSDLSNFEWPCEDVIYPEYVEI
jgi:hypothetical protein